jgi:hypothetical protein
MTVHLSRITRGRRRPGVNLKLYARDVETANSWSSNTSLNRYAIQGAATRLAGSGLPVGVYSSSSMWTALMASAFTPSGIEADWETAGGVCATTGFTSNPVWLVQSTIGGLDSDAAC